MLSAPGLWQRLPDDWRRAIGLRRARKWLAALIHIHRHNRRLPADAPVLNFYPHRPAPRAKIYGALRALGMRAGQTPRPDQPTIAWDPYTVLAPRVIARLPANAINRGCIDIRKSRVDAAWAEVSGYSVSVDPTTFSGQMVVKSEHNGRHDGKIVEGPVARPRSDRVYQRFIETRDDGLPRTQRTFIVGTECPLVLDIARPAGRFFDGVATVAVRQPSEIYSADEVETLLRFARAIGMDYGEIDVVRASDSRLIYAIDANRTPMRGRAMPLPTMETDVFAPLAVSFGRLLARWQPL